MATYYSPLFDNAFPLNTTKTPIDRDLYSALKLYKKRAALIKALNGAAVGAANAVASNVQVQHSQTELGGKRTIETRTLINRATTNSDKSFIDKLTNFSSRIATPTNKAGSFPA